MGSRFVTVGKQQISSRVSSPRSKVGRYLKPWTNRCRYRVESPERRTRIMPLIKAAEPRMHVSSAMKTWTCAASDRPTSLEVRHEPFPCGCDRYAVAT